VLAKLAAVCEENIWETALPIKIKLAAGGQQDLPICGYLGNQGECFIL